MRVMYNLTDAMDKYEYRASVLMLSDPIRTFDKSSQFSEYSLKLMVSYFLNIRQKVFINHMFCSEYA